MPLTRVPLVTRALPGTGGVLKRNSADFVVTEIPLYEPSGAGEHVYVRHRRANRTTRDVVKDLARAFGIDERDVGYAGLKDRRAIATQTFSLPLREPDLAVIARRVDEHVAGETLDVKRHVNKLKRGHLIGNRFEIRLFETTPDALDRARAVAEELARRGLPNAFGPQRYGDDGRNAEHGRALLARPRGGWLARLHLSAWQSSLFDTWLALRLERGLFERVVAGDVAKKLANGALFDVVDEAAENARVAAREITHTGPMFGADMRRAGGAAAELEDEVFVASGVTLDELARARLEGARRAGRIFVEELELEAIENGLRFAFRLPKGSYATTLLREFTKNDCALDDDED
jgi:tRNA pseudouridine13 synthase